MMTMEMMTEMGVFFDGIVIGFVVSFIVVIIIDIADSEFWNSKVRNGLPWNWHYGYKCTKCGKLLDTREEKLPDCCPRCGNERYIKKVIRRRLNGFEELADGDMYEQEKI